MGPWLPQYNPPACNVFLQSPPPQPNPLLVPGTNRELLAEQVADVVDDYFRVDREERPTQIGDYLTEGRIETLPEVSATCFEPWRHDTATHYERLESTLQSMRRRATVRMIPDPGGYLVEVQVYKELEDVLQPEHATAGAATFRYDTALERYATPVPVGGYTEGWIPQGRDYALEQQMLAQIHERLIGPCQGATWPGAGLVSTTPEGEAAPAAAGAPGEGQVVLASAVAPAADELQAPEAERSSENVAAADAPSQRLDLPKLEDDPAAEELRGGNVEFEYLPPVEPESAAANEFAEEGPRPEPGWVEVDRERSVQALWGRIVDDYCNYYSCRNLGLIALGIGVAAPVANTNLDREFGEFYQKDVQSEFTDDLSSIFKPFGEGRYFIPAYAGLTALYYWGPESCWTELPGLWGEKALRAVLVGAPPMYFAQLALGAGRPGENIHASRWTFFRDSNAVSGHAFLGSLPFLTAANMTDKPVLKAGLYALSVLPAWTRVNDDAHFLSQAALGWWFGYLAASVVAETDAEGRFHVVGAPLADGVGMGLEWRF
jgi:hypothetical protein